jgi:SAM-dependent methyltransferase
LIRRIDDKIRSEGILSIPREIGRRVFRTKAKCFKQNVQLIQGCFGLEIGGPSSIFNRGRLLPIYPLVRLDNCNFSANTVWGDNKNDKNFFYDKEQPPGIQYVCDATEMKCIPSGNYDLVISSHVLEHIANPIKALREWLRVLKERGILILLLPQKDRTFDHRRPVTTLAHLIQDHTNNTTESDLTHLSEVLELHDLKRDSVSRDRAYLERMCKENINHRYMHHHVFDTQLAVDLISHMGLQIIAVEVQRPYHIILMAQKVHSDQMSSN